MLSYRRELHTCIADIKPVFYADYIIRRICYFRHLPTFIYQSRSGIVRCCISPGNVTKAIHILENGAQKIATSRRHRNGREALLVTTKGVKSTTARYKFPWLHI